MQFSIDIITNICLAIVSFYLFKFTCINKQNSTDINDEDDDIPFQSNVDKRSLRPSYKRFMRRKLQQELNKDPYLCVICWNDRKTVVLLPCKHLCVCVACSKKICNNTQRETCPICRSEINNLLEVFL